MLFRMALRFTGDPADAEDLVQDTIFRAYRQWERYVPGTNVKGWLVTILRHAFINEYRSRERRRQILEERGGGPATSLHATFQGFEDFGDEEVMRAIAALRSPYREVVVLREIEELAYEDIARTLGVPMGTVRSRLHRAREMLKESLMDYAVSTGVIKREARIRGK